VTLWHLKIFQCVHAFIEVNTHVFSIWVLHLYCTVWLNPLLHDDAIGGVCDPFAVFILDPSVIFIMQHVRHLHSLSTSSAAPPSPLTAPSARPPPWPHLSRGRRRSSWQPSPITRGAVATADDNPLTDNHVSHLILSFTTDLQCHRPKSESPTSQLGILHGLPPFTWRARLSASAWRGTERGS
jgi:hypothetical protein